MDADSSRRYTDREVAVVLRRASEIEEAGAGSAGSLSRTDLEEIAREVGISGAALTRALAELDHRKEPGSLLLGAPRVHKAVRAVEGELNDEALARLVRLVDERAEGNGVISEALGSVRWTSSDRFQNTQVSITPDGGETTIHVVEKMVARLKGAIHGAPTGWGAIGGVIAVGTAGLTGGVAVLTVVAGAGVGLGVGRLAWNLISARSARRVERLAAELSREANDAARRGLLEKGGEDAPE